jgi:hypothetical protein
LPAWSISVSAEKLSQKFVMQKAPYAPSNAARVLSSSLMSARTISTPAAASACACSLVGSRVMARAAKSPSRSARIARTSPPPWAPVAPMTAITFLSLISLLSSSSGHVWRTPHGRRSPIVDTLDRICSE